MQWTVGEDRIHRATLGDYTAAITLYDMRSRYRITIYHLAGGKLTELGPYVKMRNARKSAEALLRRLNGKEEA